MISSRTDYLYVDIDDDLLIDGGVMPRRTDPVGKNSARCLRAEDSAHLLESVAYLDAAMGNGTTSKHYTVDRKIESDRYKLVAEHYNSINCIQISYGQEEQTVTTQWDIPYDQWNSDCPMQQYSVVSKPQDFGYGKTLSIAKVYQLFDDCRNLKVWKDSSQFRNFSCAGRSAQTAKHYANWDDTLFPPNEAAAQTELGFADNTLLYGYFSGDYYGPSYQGMAIEQIVQASRIVGYHTPPLAKVQKLRKAWIGLRVQLLRMDGTVQYSYVVKSVPLPDGVLASRFELSIQDTTDIKQSLIQHYSLPTQLLGPSVRPTNFACKVDPRMDLILEVADHCW